MIWSFVTIFIWSCFILERFVLKVRVVVALFNLETIVFQVKLGVALFDLEIMRPIYTPLNVVFR